MLYLNSRNIPELKGLSFAERMQVVRKACDNLPVPTKVSLNIVKLLILVPLFLLIARSEGWAIGGYIMLLLVLYPLLTRPLTFALCRKNLSSVRQQLLGK